MPRPIHASMLYKGLNMCLNVSHCFFSSSHQSVGLQGGLGGHVSWGNRRSWSGHHRWLGRFVIALEAFVRVLGWAELLFAFCYSEDLFQTVRLFEEEPETQLHLPHKHDLITLLAVGGHWVTTEQNLQVSGSIKVCVGLAEYIIYISRW